MRTVLWGCIVLIFSACSKDDISGGTVSDLTGTKLHEYIVYPSMTNSAIVLYNNPHYVYLDTRVATKNKLFIFLPGTSGFPSVYTLIAKKAASLGYHSIGLMYPNGSEMYVASGSNTDNTSFGRCRQEVFDGTDQTLALSVDANNSIKGRLTKLLQYLNNQYPAQNWGQYLINGQVDWSKCILAGHSQGGGHALYISKKVSVSKAISFASIDWNAALGRSADWVTDAGLTPVSKLFSVNSTRDQIFAYANVQTQLNDMGFQGVPTSIDTVASPYGQSHRLITSATPAISLLVPDHNLTCLDQYVPKTPSGAVASFMDTAWTYLITH